MTKPRDIQGTPEAPEPTDDRQEPETTQANPATLDETLLSPTNAKNPSIINR